MEPEELQQWVMTMRPGRSTTANLITPETCVIAVASGGGTYDGSIERTASIREFVWAHALNHVWICHVDMDRDPHIPTKGETIRSLVYDDGWIPADLACQHSYRGANTRTQAIWTAKRVATNKSIKHVIAACAWYHNARWALSIAQALHDEAVQDVMLSVLPSLNHEPLKKSRVSQTVLEEILRIETYQTNGHVATHEIAKRYF